MKIISWKFLSLAALAWYLFLAVLHYYNLRPLWNDEACVFRSVQLFNSSDFFSRPLYSLQVFPHLYLWLIKQCAGLYDYSLAGLRLLPFLAMVGAACVWSALASRKIASGRLLALFLLSWPASTMLVYYASELKQYSLDILLTGIYLLFVVSQEKLSRSLHPGVYRTLLFCLPFLGLLSYPVFMFLIFPFWRLFKDKEQGKAPLAVYALGCMLAAGCSYRFDMRFRDAQVVLAHKEMLISYASAGDFFKTLTDGVNNLISRWFASKPYWVRVPTRIFMLFGVVEIVIGVREFLRQKEKAALPFQAIAAVVFLELFFLGSIGAYPFIVPRTALFFCPLLFLMSMLSFQRIEARDKRWGVIVQAAYALMILYWALAVTRMAVFSTVGEDLTGWLLF